MVPADSLRIVTPPTGALMTDSQIDSRIGPVPSAFLADKTSIVASVEQEVDGPFGMFANCFRQFRLAATFRDGGTGELMLPGGLVATSAVATDSSGNTIAVPSLSTLHRQAVALWRGDSYSDLSNAVFPIVIEYDIGVQNDLAVAIALDLLGQKWTKRNDDRARIDYVRLKQMGTSIDLYTGTEYWR